MALLYHMTGAAAIFALIFASYGLPCVSCQTSGAIVYIGTGVNGSYDGKEWMDLPTNNTVLLGGLFAIHSSKDNMCAHQDIQPMIIQDIEAMVLSIDKINKDKKLLPGITLAYEIKDTCLLTNHALEQTLSFLRNEDNRKGSSGVSGVVGTSFSSVSIAVNSLLRLFKIPQISYSATANELSDASRFDYFFRIVPPDSLQARAIADIIIYFNWTYVTAIYSNDAYGKGGIRTLYNLLDAHSNVSLQKICIPQLIYLDDTDTSGDYDWVVEQLNKEWMGNASVVVLFGHLRNAEAIFEAVLRRQMSNKSFSERNITWIGSDSWGDAISPRYHEVAHGLLSTIPRRHSDIDFDRHFLSLHPRNNSANQWFIEYWETIFNCSLRNKADVPQCDLDNQRQSIEAGYKQNSFLPYVEDAVYAFAHAIHNLQQDYCPEGNGLCPEILETHLKGTAINGELLLQYLYNVSFNGTSVDRIRFDENRSIANGYNIINLQMGSDGKFKYVTVGKWDKYPKAGRKTSLLIYDNIQWKHSLKSSNVPESVCSHPCGIGQFRHPVPDLGSCCWMCMQCEGVHQVSDGVECMECKRGFKPNENKSKCVYVQATYFIWTEPLAIIVAVLALIGITATISVSIVFIIYRNERIIKASSRELNAVLLCGILLCYLMPFLYIAKPSPALCAIQRFSVGFCFSLCFSALLVKTNRIHRIFNRESLSLRPPPLISPTSQLFFTAMLVSVQVVIATVWLAAEHPSVVVTYHEHFVTELSCGENPYIGLSITFAYNLLLLTVTLYFAFKTRKVPANFNEARFINLNMYTLLVLWLAFVPTYFITTALRSSFHTGTIVIAIILSGTAILCCLLVPKVYFLFSLKRKGVDYQSSSRNLGRAYPNSMRTDPGSGSATPGMHKSFNIGGNTDASVQTDDICLEQELSCKNDYADVFIQNDASLDNNSSGEPNADSIQTTAARNLLGNDVSVQTDPTINLSDVSIQTEPFE